MALAEVLRKQSIIMKILENIITRKPPNVRRVARALPNLDYQENVSEEEKRKDEKINK